MVDFYLDCGYVVSSWVSDKLNMILCVGLTLAGLFAMGVWGIELLP